MISARARGFCVSGAVCAVLLLGRSPAGTAQSCGFTVAPTTVGSPSAGSGGIIHVDADQSTCTWTASSGAAWASIDLPIYGYGGRVLGDAPLAYWRLNESSGTAVNDLSGHGLAGTRTTGVSLSAGGALAESDAAMAFDGATGRIQVNANARLNLTSALTAEAWIKTAGTGG